GLKVGRARRPGRPRPEEDVRPGDAQDGRDVPDRSRERLREGRGTRRGGLARPTSGQRPARLAGPRRPARDADDPAERADRSLRHRKVAGGGMPRPGKACDDHPPELHREVMSWRAGSASDRSLRRPQTPAAYAADFPVMSRLARLSTRCPRRSLLSTTHRFRKADRPCQTNPDWSHFAATGGLGGFQLSRRTAMAAGTVSADTVPAAARLRR